MKLSDAICREDFIVKIFPPFSMGSMVKDFASEFA